MEDRRLGEALADPLAAQVEVVVLEEDDRTAVLAGRLDGGIGQADVDRPVAVAPGIDQRVVDVRAVGRGIHLVVDEPQERVGDDPVVAVVFTIRDGDVDQPHVLPGQVLVDQRPDRAPAPSALGVGAVRAGCPGGPVDRHPAEDRPDPPVGRGHRRGDPGHRCVTAQLGEGRDEATRPPDRREGGVLAFGVQERERTAVRDHDEPPVAAQQVVGQRGRTIWHGVQHARFGRRCARSISRLTLQGGNIRRPPRCGCRSGRGRQQKGRRV